MKDFDEVIAEMRIMSTIIDDYIRDTNEALKSMRLTRRMVDISNGRFLSPKTRRESA